MPKAADVAGVFNDSLERLAAHPTFFMRFYELFLASSDEVREKFKSTDLKRQINVLRASFYYILLASRGDPAAAEQLESVAARHSRHRMNIPPRLYDLWLESLVRAVKECDSRFNPKVEQAWRVTMEWGIRFMMSHY